MGDGRRSAQRVRGPETEVHVLRLQQTGEGDVRPRVDRGRPRHVPDAAAGLSIRLRGHGRKCLQKAAGVRRLDETGTDRRLHQAGHEGRRQVPRRQRHSQC